MRELRLKCGMLVMTPDGVREIHSYDPNGTAVTTVTEDGGSIRVWHVRDLRPLPADISRERVEALHAAVTARLEQLEASRAATWYASERDIYTACHSDLSKVAEALRLLLEVDHA